MKVLFVCSGNAPTPTGATSIVTNQGASLESTGIDVVLFVIYGRGILSYLKAIPKLHAFLRGKHYDVVHAHYSLSAYVAALAGCRPLVVSLMGSDAQVHGLWAGLLKVFNKCYFKEVIVKSEDMAKKLKIRAHVIPNGVNFARFTDIPRDEARAKVGFTPGRKYIIWASKPSREEKNFALAQEAVQKLNDPNTELYVVSGVPHSDIPLYMYAADALLLTSRYEGSPNVIKEALYCNLPIVSTDVGDVRERIGDCDGCWIANDADEMAAALKQAMNHGKTNGRERVSNLDDRIIASQIASIYKRITG